MTGVVLTTHTKCFQPLALQLQVDPTPWLMRTPVFMCCSYCPAHTHNYKQIFKSWFLSIENKERLTPLVNYHSNYILSMLITWFEETIYLYREDLLHIVPNFVSNAYLRAQVPFSTDWSLNNPKTWIYSLFSKWQREAVRGTVKWMTNGHS